MLYLIAFAVLSFTGWVFLMREFENAPLLDKNYKVVDEQDV